MKLVVPENLQAPTVKRYVEIIRVAMTNNIPDGHYTLDALTTSEDSPTPTVHFMNPKFNRYTIN